MKTRVIAAALFACSVAQAGGPAPLWDDVAHPNRPECIKIANDARRIAVIRNSGEREYALTLVVRGLRHCPKDVEVLALIGDLHLRLGDVIGARTVLEQARALSPAGEDRDPLLSLTLGRVRSLTGDLEAGLSELRRAEAIGGLRDPWRVPREMGDNLMALGRLSEAIFAYRRAVRLGPHATIARFALAVALDRDGQIDVSRNELSVALARDHRLQSLSNPEWPFVPPGDQHYYLALAQRARGRHVEAGQALAEFLKFVPDSPYAARARELLQSLSP
jgi:tetratricopeptide (TPR) repeat protein